MNIDTTEKTIPSLSLEISNKIMEGDYEEAALLFSTIPFERREHVSIGVIGFLDDPEHINIWEDMYSIIVYTEQVPVSEDGRILSSVFDIDLSVLGELIHGHAMNLSLPLQCEG